jgi:tetratricopeptide (TPR) repeat protein
MSQQHRSAEAEVLFVQAIELDRPNTWGWVSPLLILLLDGQSRPEASQLARASVSEARDDDISALAAFNLGSLFRDFGRPDESLELFTAVGESGTSMAPVANIALAHLLDDLGEPMTAETAYERAIASGHPREAPVAMVDLALLLLRQRRYGEAARQLRVAMDSGHPEQSDKATVTLASVMCALRNYTEASELYRRAMLSSNPELARMARDGLAALVNHVGLQGTTKPSRRRRGKHSDT